MTGILVTTAKGHDGLFCSQKTVETFRTSIQILYKLNTKVFTINSIFSAKAKLD